MDLQCSHREQLFNVGVSTGEVSPNSLRGADIIIPRPFGTVLYVLCSIPISMPKTMQAFRRALRTLSRQMIHAKQVRKSFTAFKSVIQ